MTERTAWIAGATGLVGSHLVDALLEDPLFDRVCALVRRPMDRRHPKLSQHTVDFGALRVDGIPTPTDAFCALGTTIARAGSQEAFRAVDHDAVLAFARAARDRGARNAYAVTALGADAKSWTFYNRVKGEAEEGLRAVAFPSLAIVRPSLLDGERAESRPGERLAIVVGRALRPVLKGLNARPIEARTVALSLRALAHHPPVGSRVYLSHELFALAEEPLS